MKTAQYMLNTFLNNVYLAEWSASAQLQRNGWDIRGVLESSGRQSGSQCIRWIGKSLQPTPNNTKPLQTALNSYYMASWLICTVNVYLGKCIFMPSLYLFQVFVLDLRKWLVSLEPFLSSILFVCDTCWWCAVDRPLSCLLKAGPQPQVAKSEPPSHIITAQCHFPAVKWFLLKHAVHWPIRWRERWHDCLTKKLHIVHISCV